MPVFPIACPVARLMGLWLCDARFYIGYASLAAIPSYFARDLLKSGMKKLNFGRDIWPHGLAVLIFLLVTILFFNPLFFGNKSLNQGDINQFLWGSKEQRDYREATGEEGLWANTMFSGMPAYMINMDWSDGVVTGMKRVLSIFLPHPVNNIFLAFLCYYLLLLSFRVRPFLAIAGSLAFGITSYMIIGLSAGHNARIGAIAFMPLVMAGIHLAFTGKRWLGLAATAAGLALHLRENHLQMTYYLLLIVVMYGALQLFYAFREKQLPQFFKTIGVLVVAATLAVGTFFGPLWAVNELSKYSTRGKSELISTSNDTAGSGLPKSYAFQYSYSLAEPFTLLIPNFFGGSSSLYLFNDTESNTYRALAQVGDQNAANQLAQFTSPYWGDQPLSAPYYAGAIIVFLFVLGLMAAERKYVVWLVAASVLGIMLSWGSSLAAFNYFLFDYLPGYNKFRSVTFAMVMVFFSFPLLGMLGLEKFLTTGLTKENKKKLLIAFGTTAGLCVLLALSAGMFSFSRPVESQLPTWFLNALRADRKALFQSDVWRSAAFIFSIAILMYFDIPKKISPTAFYLFLMSMVVIDHGMVSSRYFPEEIYQRKRDVTKFEPGRADAEMMKDTGIFRVLNLANFYEARTSYFNRSLGGYHGVRLKRYQELTDSCILREADEFIRDAQQGRLNFQNLGVLNMLNARYLFYGDDVLRNTEANGNAWFVTEVAKVNNPNEELAQVSLVDTKKVAVINDAKFKLQQLPQPQDSTAYIQLVDQKPYWQKYDVNTSAHALAVFSEIYYPKGWTATIDGKEAPILQANYVLRALEVPPGKHSIEFIFQPKPYLVGNKVTMASSWLLLLVVVGSVFFSWKKEE